MRAPQDPPMTGPAADFDARLERFAQSLFDSAKAQQISWLDMLFAFGVAMRAMIDAAPATLEDAEQQAHDAFTKGFNGPVELGISPPARH